MNRTDLAVTLDNSVNTFITNDRSLLILRNGDMYDANLTSESNKHF